MGFRRTLSRLVLAGASACGGSTEPADEGTSSGESGSATTTSGTGPGTTTTTGPDATDATDATGTTATGTTGGDADAIYEAFYIAGGLDRVRVTRRDPAADRCAWLMLVWPGGADPGDVAVPEQWGVESVVLSDRGADCVDPLGPQGELAEPETASGAITFPSTSGVLPCTLSIDVGLAFVAPPVWVPSAVELSAEDLVVLGTPGCA